MKLTRSATLLAGYLVVKTLAQQPAHAQSHCPVGAQVELALAQASQLLDQAKYTTAAEELQPLATLNCDPRLSLLLAAAFDGLAQPASAESALQQAHTVWPANNSIAASLAREDMAAGQLDAAVQALAHFRPNNATPPQELDAAAVTLLAGHQLVAAHEVAAVAYHAHPSTHTILLLANTLQLEGRYKDVIALLDSRRKTYSQSAPFLVTLAESEYDADMLDPARRDLELSIELDRTLYQAHYLLGNVLMKQGDIDGASASYRRAITLAPDQPRTYYQLALALRARQDETGEQLLLEKALSIDSKYGAAHSELGRIYLNQNRLTEAVGELNSAIENNPTLEQPYNLLARAYERLGDTEKAEAMSRRLVAVRAEKHKGAQPESIAHAQ
jgi:Flp pilus assembly protein TadD